MKKYSVNITDEAIELTEIDSNEYKFQIHDDFVAENVGLELKEQGLAETVFFNKKKNTVTLEISKEKFNEVCEFISEYGFILE